MLRSTVVVCFVLFATADGFTAMMPASHPSKPAAKLALLTDSHLSHRGQHTASPWPRFAGVSNGAQTSETKVREMASFLAAQLLEKALQEVGKGESESKLSLEDVQKLADILQTSQTETKDIAETSTSLEKEETKAEKAEAQLKGEEGDEKEDNEIPTTVDKKKPDDELPTIEAPEEPQPESVLEEPKEKETETLEEVSPSAESISKSGVARIPAVVSKDFGKPLEVVKASVPPLRESSIPKKRVSDEKEPATAALEKISIETQPAKDAATIDSSKSDDGAVSETETEAEDDSEAAAVASEVPAEEEEEEEAKPPEERKQEETDATGKAEDETSALPDAAKSDDESSVDDAIEESTPPAAEESESDKVKDDSSHPEEKSPDDDDDEEPEAKGKFRQPMRTFFSRDESSPLTDKNSPDNDVVPTDVVPPFARSERIAQARQQPKSLEEEAELAFKYGSMPLDERAFAILQNLGMLE